MLAVAFAGMLTKIALPACEHYITSIQYIMYQYTDAILITDLIAHYFVHRCLCYLKQRCKSYKLFNKHNKDVELSDFTSAESLENSQNRYVKGLGSVCKMLVVVLFTLLMQQTNKHRFKFTKVT